MISPQKDFSLSSFNTFCIDAKAKYFLEIEKESDLQDVLSHKIFSQNPKYILAGGSNTLFTRDLEELVLHINLKGIAVVKETDRHIYLKVSAGEDWSALVDYVVDQNWGGIENLALIPGLVGAAPVQNIACYGQNLIDVFESLEAINLDSGVKEIFNKKDCHFAYRDSIFKHELRGKFCIVTVTLKLTKQPKNLETSYFMMHVTRDSIASELETFAKKPYSIKDVSQAVKNIRTRKLPDASKIPTVGSFFINPTVSKEKLIDLQKEVKDLQYYPLENLTYNEISDTSFIKDDFVKVPAGRLLDELGWRGKWIGNVGVHDKQALIIITNGKASGKEILEFSMLMRSSVKEAYDIDLETEVNIV
ncbi:MAG: UDP-N-acetylmuramate dehydrogenase [Candidatus Roizmanbacteria bacterium]